MTWYVSQPDAKLVDPKFATNLQALTDAKGIAEFEVRTFVNTSAKHRHQAEQYDILSRDIAP